MMLAGLQVFSYKGYYSELLASEQSLCSMLAIDMMSLHAVCTCLQHWQSEAEEYRESVTL
jgi:hypothetical protein